MTRAVATIAAVVIVAGGCTGNARSPRATPSLASPTEAGEQGAPLEAEIYAALIRHLITEDDTFGRGRFSYKMIYVLDGPKGDAARPRGDVFGSPRQSFGADVVAAIHEELSDLPPLRFVSAGADALRSGNRMGEVRGDGVLLLFGPVRMKDDRALVSNTFWCGGKCSQWVTFVLTDRGGPWQVRGTTGPVTMS